MSDVVPHGFLPYPEIAEELARGSVRAVYAAARSRFPVVPALFRSLALWPPYLRLAWSQSVAVLDTKEFASATGSVVEHAAGVCRPHPDPVCRRFLAHFATGRMLVLACGLQATLRGTVEGVSAASEELADGNLTLDRPPTLFAPAQTDDPLLEEIRASLRTPIANSVWLVASRRGILHDVWDGLRDQVPNALSAADRARDHAASQARDTVAWRAVADAGTLRDVGIVEAMPGIDAVLEAYIVTLARMVVLLAGCAEPQGGGGSERGVGGTPQ